MQNNARLLGQRRILRNISQQNSYYVFELPQNLGNYVLGLACYVFEDLIIVLFPDIADKKAWNQIQALLII